MPPTDSGDNLAGEYAALMERARAGLAAADPDAPAAAAQAAEAALAEGDLRGAAAARRLYGQALRVFGRHAEAVEALGRAAEAAWQAGDTRLAAQVQVGAVDSLGWLGRYDDAEALARQLESELRAAGAELDAARVLVNAANLHFRRDQYAVALAEYRRAGEAFARGGDAVSRARVDGNCANVLTHLNRTTEAIGLYDAARATFAELGMAPEAAMVDGNVGYLRFVSGMTAAALASFARARQAFEERGQAIEAAKADLDMGDAYRALNLFPEALERYEAGAGAFVRAQVDYERAKCEMGRAVALAALDRTVDAFTALDAADAVFRAQRNAVQAAHARLVRSSLLLRAGRADEARMEALRAAPVFARHGLAAWSAEARFLPVSLALEADGESADRAARAARTMRGIARTARQQGHGWLECRAERALGRYYRRRGDRGATLRHLRAAVAALEGARTQIAPEEMHVAFLRDKLDVYDDLIGALLERGRPGDPYEAEALRVVEQARSRLLLERLQSALEGRGEPSGEAPAGGAAADLRRRLAELRTELSRGYHGLQALDEREQERLVGAGPGSAGVDSLARLEREYEAVRRRLELCEGEAVLGGALASTPPDAHALRAALADEETLIEYYAAGDCVSAFVLSRGGLRVCRQVARTADVRHAARRLRFHLQKLVGAELPARAAEQQICRTREVLAQLYDLLLRPTERMLCSSAGRLIIAPHGPLHGLPFHAFHDGAADALDRWEIAYAPSAAVWHAGRARGAATKSAPAAVGALLMAVPSPGIEHVAAEVADLWRIVPGARAYCGGGATLEAFRQEAGRSGRIHLATHALFRQDNPLFSGIRFADDWLLARDLYAMRLDCDLATLSACQTGVSAVDTGDELFGLLRGFLAAGVRSVVASLWPAADAATAALMRRFYGLLLEGQPKAAALREAQRALRREYPHPYHWAAFALVGEG